MKRRRAIKNTTRLQAGPDEFLGEDVTEIDGSSFARCSPRSPPITWTTHGLSALEKLLSLCDVARLYPAADADAEPIDIAGDLA